MCEISTLYNETSHDLCFRIWNVKLKNVEPARMFGQ